MVAAALEEGVPQVGEVRHAALHLRLAQHAQVPLAQVLAARRLLPARVAVQDVVVTLQPEGATQVTDSPFINGKIKKRLLSHSTQQQAEVAASLATNDTLPLRCT